MTADKASLADAGPAARDVRKGRKYDQVIAGAQEVFMRDGFEGASVDEIARNAGVSKATLYSYFPDKRLLFMECACAQCNAQADEALLSIDFARPPEQVLPIAGHKLLGFMLSDNGQNIFRICVAEADRFPELGRRFYESGPMMVRRALGSYLEVARQRGEIVADDLTLAADQFAELCKADLWVKLMFGIQTEFSPEERSRIVDGALQTFMARYGAK
ncbi:AcrR family transcriptional regulator [Sagittula marina]|uniref:AcrR family transcriptional regulator n=1 Tax=Sagittula marina TaxID=943940 RepID=A0A7W6GQI8_9RHOB|nr:TetR/AcrR family transcriptional regulator [Sagittula marina]MBB3983930.1 AcrR family transcriptional regulator [Sagittula marina]